MIIQSQQMYGRQSRNAIDQALAPGIDGARALMEAFYYAFNQRNLEVFGKVWAKHELIQLNNPLGGILRGNAPVAALYQRIFSGPASVWVELSDIVEYQTDSMVVFAGRETGEFTREGKSLPLAIRTSRIIQWFGPETGWKQVHHHGSIDQSPLLAAYQEAVK